MPVDLPGITEVHGSSLSARRTAVSCRPSASRTQAFNASHHAGAGLRCCRTFRQNMDSASTVETLAAGRHQCRQYDHVQSIAHAQFNSLFVAQRSTRTEIIQFQWPCCLFTKKTVAFWGLNLLHRFTWPWPLGQRNSITRSHEKSVRESAPRF